MAARSKSSSTAPVPARGGFFLNGADWLLSRLPFTKDRYGHWSNAKRIIIGYLLYLIILPVIPIVIGIIMYRRDPQNFLKSPAAKVIGGLIILQLSAFGLIAVQPSTPLPDQTDRAASDQTEVSSSTNAKKATVKDKDASDTTPVEQGSQARKDVQTKSTSESTGGRYYDNCDAAFERGVFDIPRYDKSYRPALDRDDDGVACEK